MKQRVILIVDDLEITRQATALAVEALGFEWHEASDGPTALEMVKNTAYCAILMDFSMPRMNGAECTEKIREMEKETGSRTPVIGLSASTEPEVRRKCIDADMDDFIDKSCSNSALLCVLEKWARSFDDDT